VIFAGWGLGTEVVAEGVVLQPEIRRVVKTAGK
jgi:hypothetical protein